MEEIWSKKQQTPIKQIVPKDLLSNSNFQEKKSMMSPLQHRAKRMVDIFCAVLLLTLFLPLYAIISVAILTCMGKPIFFFQTRVGKNAKPFLLYKFRTMTNVTKSSSAEPQITRLGKILRDWSVDELPQLINVLKGDMSLVGPRPLPEGHMPYLEEKEKRRHDVLPGLTGLAQINGRNSLNWEKKFAKDLEYIENQSFSLDIRILLKTVIVVLLRRGITYDHNLIAINIDQERQKENNKKAS